MVKAHIKGSALASTVSRDIVRNGGRAAYRRWLPIRLRSGGRGVRKWASWPRMRSWRAWSMPNLMTIGRYGGSPSRRGGSIPVPRVSHESIYRDVYSRRGRHSTAASFTVWAVIVSRRRPLGKRSSGRGQIRNSVSIQERPVEADTREVAGHRERL